MFISTPKCRLWAILLVTIAIHRIETRWKKKVRPYERIPPMESDLQLSDVSGWFTAWSSISRADFQPPSTMRAVWGHPPAPLPPAPRPPGWPPPSGSVTPASPAEMGSADSQPESRAQSTAFGHRNGNGRKHLSLEALLPPKSICSSILI